MVWAPEQHGGERKMGDGKPVLGGNDNYYVEFYWVARGPSKNGGRSNDALGQKCSKKRVAALVMLVPIKHNQIIFINISDQTLCNALGCIATVL